MTNNQQPTTNSQMFNRGFTLIELLVAIGIALIVVSVSVEITTMVKHLVARGSDKLEAIQYNRALIDRISRDVRQAKAIVTTLPDISQTGVSEVAFENGHDVEKINYIRYIQSGKDIIKENYHYSFSANPDIWVAWNVKDSSDNSPDLVMDSQDTVASSVTSFYLNQYEDQIISFEIITEKNQQKSQMKGEVLARNAR